MLLGADPKEGHKDKVAHVALRWTTADKLAPRLSGFLFARCSF